MTKFNRGWATVAGLAAVATLGVSAGLAVNGKGGKPAPSSPTPAATAPAVAAVAASAEKPAAAAEARDCIYGMSKDACEGRLKGESQYFTGCDAGPLPCRTYHLNDAKFDLYLASSNLTCSTTPESERGLCDEFRNETDGRFDARVSVVLRQQEPCRFRGTIDGEATYRMNSGPVYSGKIIGLIGSGADRVPACHTEVPIARCESCLDIQFVKDADPTYWRLGTEIIFEGVRTDIATGERLRLNISGSFTSNGGRDGPERLNEYRFIGTADGVQIFVCN
ncbi:MAG: hypothetical protein QM783_14925 [Phycisphaerales bacterium]